MINYLWRLFLIAVAVSLSLLLRWSEDEDTREEGVVSFSFFLAAVRSLRAFLPCSH